jgi:arsenical-resistance protein 2
MTPTEETAKTEAPKPWYAAYPEAKSEAATISRDDVLAFLKTASAKKDFVLVDLRRTDFEVCRKKKPDDRRLVDE